jgi:hypothetical protein
MLGFGNIRCGDCYEIIDLYNQCKCTRPEPEPEEEEE